MLIKLGKPVKALVRETSDPLKVAKLSGAGIQVVKLFEKATGKTFEVSHVPAEALKAQMEGATDPMEKTFAGLMYCYAVGDPTEMKATLKAFPLELASVQDYVKKSVSLSLFLKSTPIP